jgi:GNAT superfamily N-acetyltransferase
MGIKQATKSVVGMIVSEYRINWIFASSPELPARSAAHGQNAPVPIDGDLLTLITASATPKVKNSISFNRAGLPGFAIVEAGKPVCVAHFASPEQYDRASTWPLREGERALMDIATEESARGRGLAVRLIAEATQLYRHQGVHQLIAFIWWSNTPSTRAFNKAGWQKIGLAVEIQIGSRWFSLRLPIARRRQFPQRPIK